jgi:hypothetical protein
MIVQIRSLLLVLLFAALVLPLALTNAATCIKGFVDVAQQAQDEEDDSDEEDDEFEDDEDFMNNPWRVDERKLFAAKKFQLTNQFALKVTQIENICGELDKKQKLKINIACKGATEEALEKFKKSWKEQMKQFGNQFQTNDDDDDDKEKKKKRKKKKKRFVVKKVDDIDAQTMQMMDNAMFGGVQTQDHTDVPRWTRTVKKVLDKEQRKKLDAHTKKLKIAKRNARAETFLADMRLRLALGEDQIEEFDKLVRPAFLKKDIEVSWNYEAMATLYLGSKYDKKKMKELLSEEQYLVLTLAVKPAEGYAGMFGDNNNVVVGRQVVVANGPLLGFLDGMLDAVDDLAELLVNPFEGLFN